MDYDRSGRGRYVEGVTVPDSNKDTYTVTQGRLRPHTSYSVIVVHYSSGTKIGASAVLSVTTLSKYTILCLEKDSK